MRVISGKHRGRRIESLKSKDLRPTTAMAREAIFNMLSHSKHNDGMSLVEGAVIVDLFCGCGALSMESLSRGAKKVYLMDANVGHLDVARHNIAKIGEEENAEFYRSDSTNPPLAPEKCDLIFIDPPYNKQLIQKSIKGLISNEWVKKGTIFVIETAHNEDVKFDDRLEILDDRRYGNSRIRLLRLCRDL
jgi:16S rRNA (guanine966-N2)-methyltransferase